MTYDVHRGLLLKVAAHARLSLFEAFETTRLALGFPAGETLERKRFGLLGSPGTAARIHFVEIEPGGETFALPAPPVVGPGHCAGTTGTRRAFYVATFADAVVRGRSAVVRVGDTALFDVELRERSAIDDRIEVDPAVFARAPDGDVWCIVNECDVVRVDEAFVSLLGPHSSAFGHWIWEYLPKIASAIAAGALKPMTVLIDRDMPRSHRDALAAILPAEFTIVDVAADATVRVARAWCAPAMMHMPLLETTNDRWRANAPGYIAAEAARFVALRDAVRARYPRATRVDGPDLLYLARPDGTHRRLTNRDEIEAAARLAGFTVVRPETLEFAEQVRLVRGARAIAGPEGSALFLCFFADAGTRVAILNHSETELEVVLTGILDGFGVDATIVTGPIVRANDEPGPPFFGFKHFADYEIEANGFARFLTRWTPARTSRA